MDDLAILDEELIEKLQSDIPYVIKTHGMGPKNTFKLLESDKLKSIYTVRDPIDIALSYLEAGKREIDTGKAVFLSVQECVSNCHANKAFIYKYLSLGTPQNEILPYDVLVRDKQLYISEIFRLITGTKIDVNELQRLTSIPNDKFLEFNVGRTGRGRQEFNDDQINDFNMRLHNEIRFNERIVEYFKSD